MRLVPHLSNALFLQSLALLLALPCGGLFGQTPVPAPAPAPVAAVSGQLGKMNPLGQVPAWAGLEKFSKVLTAEEFQRAFEDIYTDPKRFPPPWQFDIAGITVPTGNSSGAKVRIEFRTPDDKAATAPRFWRKASELPALEGKPVLTGLRIALDPGHIGGNFAQMEERYLSFHPNEYIAEGELSLKVAQSLKTRLEALGAQVFLVREANEPVTASRPNEFRAIAESTLREHGIISPKELYAGLSSDERMITLQYQTEKLFYRESEIRARGKKVNEVLKPDLVLCLHFNAAPWGKATEPMYSQENHLHLLINGCYAAEELQLQDVRFEMLQRLFSRIHDEELPLGEELAKSMSQSTGLPPYSYITPNARAAGKTPYLFARNLLANRIYQCPVVYMEPYVMNNEETYKRLLMGDYEGATLFNGKLRTSIFQDYVQGIVSGLTNYYRGARKP